MGERVSVFEVGPRDGLQNEPRPVSPADKLWFIENLVQAGVRDLEAGAFVRADRVPQMGDTEKLFTQLRGGPVGRLRARAWALVPNLKGLARAQASGVDRLAVFTAASETFNQRNIGMSIGESLQVIEQIVNSARTRPGVEIRGYVSTAFGCPFEGKISPRKVLRVVEKLAALGLEQISIGDTIGVAHPGQVNDLIAPALQMLGPKKTAVHFHDTRGQALANTLRSLELGVRIVDSSAGGLGGCPFAPGATGNLATEDLVYMLDGLGMRSGIRLDQLCAVSREMAKRMRRPISSRYLQAFASADALN